MTRDGWISLAVWVLAIPAVALLFVAMLRWPLIALVVIVTVLAALASQADWEGRG